MLELDAVILPLMIVVGVEMPEILFKCGRGLSFPVPTDLALCTKRSGMKHSNSLVYDARGNRATELFILASLS